MRSLSRIAVVHALLFLFVFQAYPQVEWTTVSTIPTSNILWAVTSHGDQLVAVGDSGTILASAEGKTWRIQSSGVKANLYCVAWAKNQFVAVGDSGIILTSPDGVEWTRRQSGLSGPWVNRLFSVASNDTQIVVTGYSPILTSQDGQSWTSRSTGARFNSIVWTGNQFVAVGTLINVVPANALIGTSPDGIVWNMQSPPGVGGLYSVVWTGNQCVAVGENFDSGTKPGPYDSTIITSSDLSSWTIRSSGSISRNFSSIAWTGSLLFAAGNSICLSSDGIIWESANPLNMLPRLNSIIWTGKMLVAAGYNGTIITGIPQKVSTRSKRQMSTAPSELQVRYENSRVYIAGVLKGLTTGTVSIAICSLSGKRTYESSRMVVSDELELVTGDLKPGVYQLVLEQNGKQKYKNILVDR